MVYETSLRGEVLTSTMMRCPSHLFLLLLPPLAIRTLYLSPPFSFRPFSIRLPLNSILRPPPPPLPVAQAIEKELKLSMIVRKRTVQPGKRSGRGGGGGGGGV